MEKEACVEWHSSFVVNGGPSESSSCLGTKVDAIIRQSVTSEVCTDDQSQEGAIPWQTSLIQQ
jgi:hypothetical protein